MKRLANFLPFFLWVSVVLPVWAAPGDLDTSFGGGDGWVATGLQTYYSRDYVKSTVAQSDGKIVVVGRTSPGAQGYDFVLGRYNDDGSLDTTFGGGGIVITDVDGVDEPNSVIQQADGKLVVAAAGFRILRYNSDGSLDTTFDGDGIVTTNFNPTGDTAYSVIQQTDGKLVAAGKTTINLDTIFALARYNADGSLDTTFGSGGKLTLMSGGYDSASVIQQTDGKLVVAGSIGSGNSSNFIVMRMHSNGALDTTFSDDGIVSTPVSVGDPDRCYSVIQQSDGKLVLAGYAMGGLYGQFVLVRYTNDGVLDTTFSNDGVAWGNVGELYSVVQQADGKLLVAGSDWNDGSRISALWRYNSDGTLDTSFDGDGKAPPGYGSYAYAVRIQPDGKLVVAGQAYFTETVEDLSVSRYNSDGSFDTTFSEDGRVSTNIRIKSSDSGRAVVQQADGKLAVAGYSYAAGSYDFSVIRYDENGNLDAGFGTAGFVMTSIGNLDYARAMIQQSDGKLVVAGDARIDNTSQFTMVRYNSNGTLDNSFSGDGIVTPVVGNVNNKANSLAQLADGSLVMVGTRSIASPTGASDELVTVPVTASGLALGTYIHLTTGFNSANAVIRQADGKLVVAGFSNNNIVLLRYNNYVLDTSFDVDGIVITDIGAAYQTATAVIQQADGKLVIAGQHQSAGGYDFVLVRYNSNGSLDTGFDGDGVVILPIGLANDRAYSLVQQFDGKLVVAGESFNGTNTDVALVRFNTNGSLDTTFGVAGIRVADISGLNEQAFSLAQQRDGKLVIAGTAAGFVDGDKFLIARFLSGQVDSDGDGDIDWLDTDNDNDGVLNNADALPLDPTETVDTDNDGIGNNADTDDDNDAALDASDNCPLLANPDQLNTDGDANGNVCDSDDDNDGVADITDTFPLDPTETADWDNDGVGNNADPDDDNDAALDVSDNCPLLANPDQLNTDGDANGNACDSDDDNDGVADITDTFPLDPSQSAGNTNIFYTRNGDSASDFFGQSVGAAGDVNNDGYADFIVGASQDDNNGSNSGSARVFSGANGNALYTFNGDSASDLFGYSVSGAGDVNNDGYVDVIVGAYQDDNTASNSGSARVLSGANGSILYTFNGDSSSDFFGYSVSGAGDVNNDGYDDVIVGAYGDDNNGSNSGSARVLNGANGSILYTFNGNAADDFFGYSVSGAGDINNDGYADIIVGAQAADNNGSNSGSAWVYSGANGSLLYTFNGDSAGDLFGYSVSGAGDVNNDGYADVIVGAHGDDNNGNSSGSAQVLSGADGSILYIFNGDLASDVFGYSVSDAGDVNNDDYADVIVGAYQDDNNGSSSGSARVFSGADGSILYTFNGDSSSDFFGYSVSGPGDINGDGYGDIIVGAYQDDNNGSNSGSARVFSGKGLWIDTDADGQTDTIDNDDDSDGVIDVSDVFPLDTDNDGVRNENDWDDDNDSVPDSVDAAPFNSTVATEIVLPLDGLYKGSVLQSSSHK